MVSVFVFAIGVLGFSALQTRSLQATQDNGQREDVMWVAESLVSRVRSNPEGLDTYILELNQFGDSCPEDFNETVCAQENGQGADEVAVCDADELAVFDVWDVLCNTTDVEGETTKIKYTGGLDAVYGLNIELSCQDSPGDCSAERNLALVMEWCAKSLDTETGEQDCTQDWSLQSYRLGFRP